MDKKEVAGKTLQDVGICILLSSFLLSAILFAATQDHYLEGLLMLSAMFVAVLFACFNLAGFAIVIASLGVVAFIAYKVYLILVVDENVLPISFGWILLAAMATVGALLFVNGLKKVKLENQVLKQQVEELVMIDPLTGFYNLRSMFMDTQTQISYAERNGKAISLMIIKFRYNKELKSVLKKSQYDEVIIRLSKLVFDTVRLEDKVYSLDSDGTVGVLLTCDRSGAKLVEKRIRKKIEDTDAFNNIAEKPIRMEVQLGYLEYKKEYNRDAIHFKSLVEEEVAYDL